jgi:membrane protein YdbS with pleckstrin-like domain
MTILNITLTFIILVILLATNGIVILGITYFFHSHPEISFLSIVNLSVFFGVILFTINVLTVYFLN